MSSSADDVVFSPVRSAFRKEWDLGFCTVKLNVSGK